jgi:hypothetical protein
MRRLLMNKKTVLVGIPALLVVLGYGLFHGWFDQGKFEIREAVWATGRVAMVAERSDHQAMNSNQYFVLIDDHVLSPRELRHALYSGRVIFDAGNECVTVRWRDPHSLTVGCRGGAIPANEINSQKHRANDVSIAYENIAASSRAGS